MWSAPAVEVAASHHRIAAAHPGRFLLGVGIGHPEATQEYRSPYDTIVDYLDVLDAEGVPVEDRVLAALGPKVLALAAERTAGAHPYLTTPDHTRQAREILGDGPLLAPEQKVVLDTDPVAARALGRPAVDRPYLHLRNYTSNLKRLGWTDADLAGGGSDALIDALAVHGDAATVAAGVTRPPRRRCGPRVHPAADPARRRPAARPARAGRGPRAVAVIDPATTRPPRTRAGSRPAPDQATAPRGGPAGRTFRSGGSVPRAAARPSLPRPAAGPAGTTPARPRPAVPPRSAAPSGSPASNATGSV